MFTRKLLLVIVCLAVSAFAVGFGHAAAMPPAQESGPAKLVQPDASAPAIIRIEGREATATPLPCRVYLPLLVKQDPPFTPEPGRILFSARSDPHCPLYEYLYVINSDGSNTRQLTTFSGMATEPDWSPDGAKIVFTRYYATGSCSIYIDDGAISLMNAYGSSLTRLGAGHAPDRSPDGQMIVFASDGDIYAMRSDGSDRRQLTTGSASDGDPAWSPDGRQIAFSSNREGRYHIYVMNADGSGVVRLTSHSAGHADSPAWSPDGAMIAYHYNPSVSWGDAASEIYVMNANGSGAKNITNKVGQDDSPAWSPNGTQIVFLSLRDGKRQLYLMNSNGTAQTRLTSDAISHFGPDWHR